MTSYYKQTFFKETFILMNFNNSNTLIWILFKEKGEGDYYKENLVLCQIYIFQYCCQSFVNNMRLTRINIILMQISWFSSTSVLYAVSSQLFRLCNLDINYFLWKVIRSLIWNTSQTLIINSWTTGAELAILLLLFLYFGWKAWFYFQIKQLVGRD